MDAPTRSATPDASLWPKPARWAAALLVLAAILFISWQWVRQYIVTRPTKLHRGDDLAYQIDLNRADRAELMLLPNIGPALADRIINHRREHGPFARVEDLDRVNGIGPAILESVRSWVCVTTTPPLQDSDDPREAPALAAWSEPRDAIRLERKPRAEPIPTSAPAQPTKVTPGDERIDVNSASPDELQRLPGIGEVLAARIIEERQREPFRTVEDLRRVNGIGPGRLEQVRPHVVINMRE